MKTKLILDDDRDLSLIKEFFEIDNSKYELTQLQDEFHYLLEFDEDEMFNIHRREPLCKQCITKILQDSISDFYHYLPIKIELYNEGNFKGEKC